MEGQEEHQENNGQTSHARNASHDEVLPSIQKTARVEDTTAAASEEADQEAHKTSNDNISTSTEVERYDSYSNAWAAVLDKAALLCAGILVGLMVSCTVIIALDPPSVNTSLQNFEAKSDIGEIHRSLQLASEDTAEAYRKIDHADIQSRVLAGSRDRDRVKWTLHVIFSSKEGTNMLHPQPLHEVKNIEEQIARFENYEKICAHNSTGICAEPDSILNYFLLQTDNQGRLEKEWVNTAAGKLATNDVLWYTDSSFNANNLKSSYLRSTFFFSVPDTFEGWEDRSSEQELYYKNWISLRLPDLRGLSTDTIQVNWVGDYITEHEIWLALLGDLKLCLIGMSMIALYCVVYFNSLFLATFGVLQIAFSFPLGFVLYRYIFGIHEVGMLEFLGFFLVLGIGIDDIFIFYGFYKASLQFPGVPLEKRLGYVFAHAGSSMFVTTCTSAMAFGANIFSTIPALQSFGLFMSLLVFVNFFLVLCWFPSILCLWEKHIKGTRADIAPVATFKHLWMSMKSSLPLIGGQLDALKCPQLSWKKYFILIKQWRYMCLIMTSSLVAVSAVFTSQIKPSEEFARFFPESHNVHFVSVLFDRLFLVNRQIYRGDRPPTDSASGGSHHGGGVPGIIDGPLTGSDSVANTELITLSWGLKGIQGYSSFGIGLEEDRPRVAYDDNFNISSRAAQQSVFDLCSVLEKEESMVKEVQRCFISSFASWTSRESQLSHRTATPLLIFPVPPQYFPPTLLQWLSEQPYWKRTRDVGYTVQSLPQPSYVKIMVRTTMSKSLRATDASAQYLRWKVFLSNWSTMDSWNAPPPKVSSPLFVRMATEEAAIQGLLQSLIISIASVIFALLIFTRSLTLSALAGITVTGITTVIVGFMKRPLGWSIGAVESVSLTFLVGLTVDYVLHLAKHFLASRHSSSMDRAKDAFTELGPSIFASAVTTILGVFPLFFCTVLAFVKVGLIVTLSITASLLFAFHLFVPLLLLLGSFVIRPWRSWQKVQRFNEALFCHSLRAFNASMALLLVCSVSIPSVRTYLYGNAGQTGIVLYLYASCVSLDISHSIMEKIK
uniref:SSD domain-containing protein n=1 Tax=Picocystis salinarum TaxID=88271 RepID=A0A7S3UDZ4_9CHLO